MPVAEPKLVPVYFDSALIAKFYLNEPGREQVRQVARSAGAVVSSGIAVVEVSATFHRKLREGAIELRVLRALQGQFAHDLDTGLWRLAGPTEAVLREAHAAFSRLDKSVSFGRSTRCTWSPPSLRSLIESIRMIGMRLPPPGASVSMASTLALRERRG